MLKEKLLLLVDDDEDDSFLFREILTEVDPAIKLVTAENGRVALSMLGAENAVLPDIIFLDLNMPKMDGKQCLEELKKDDLLKDIPVFIYTTSSQSKDIEYTLQLGAACFITKPSSSKDLQELLAIIGPNMHNIEKTVQLLSRHSDWVLSNA